MLTNEAIEVHLEYLRKRQDELTKDVRELRADNKSLHDKIDAVFTALKPSIEGLEERRSK